MGNTYGPDDNLPLDLSKMSTISVPKGYKAYFRFRVDAGYEQAICIYDSNDALLAEKGTHFGRDLVDWETPINHAQTPVNYKVTGWHKRTSTGSGSLPWIQSPYKRFPQTDGSVTIGFNDSGNDQDYNDITANFKLV